MKRSSKLFMGIALGTAITASAFAGDTNKIDSEVGVKKPLEFSWGDMKLNIGGKSTTEHRFAKNAVMLNNQIPDEVGHFRETIDTNFLLAYGEKKFGHKAVELGTDVRFKTMWGRPGHFAGTEKNDEFKVGKAAVGEHVHKNARTLLWVKNAWLQASWNAIFNADTDTLQHFKIGMFPFYLGRGISLGIFYGVSKNFLAIYSADNDFSPPGILLTGEIVKDTLSYDIYYAKLEEKSASFGDVFNSNKEMIIGRRATPWNGPAKDSDLFAMRLKIKPLDEKKNYGTLEIEPYLMYNEDSDQKVDLPADSKSTLGAVGLAAEYTKNNFEFGGEIAFNYGEEELYNIDRNVVLLKHMEYGLVAGGAVREVYSHVLGTAIGGATLDKQVQVTTAAHDAILANKNLTNGGVFSSNAAYKSASNRFRCGYINKYRGWMAVVDAAYTIKRIDLKAAIAYGFASGDQNPHAEEKNKNYDGFIGLHEVYSGKRVPSVFILDARKIKRPLTLIEGTNEVDSALSPADSDSSFSDLHHVGFGVTWKPKCMKKNKVSLNPNILFFWKDHDSFAYDRAKNNGQGGLSDKKASKFLGTEINLNSEIEMLKDLKLVANLAIFFPGSYYKDIKGAPMKNDLFNDLEIADKASLDSSRYRISDDTAFYSRVAIEYKF
jgi:hypothetical protein